MTESAAKIERMSVEFRVTPPRLIPVKPKSGFHPEDCETASGNTTIAILSTKFPVPVMFFVQVEAGFPSSLMLAVVVVLDEICSVSV